MMGKNDQKLTRKNISETLMKPVLGGRGVLSHSVMSNSLQPHGP